MPNYGRTIWRPAKPKTPGFDPTNPYAGMADNTDPGYGGTTSRILGQAGQSGAFDPQGSVLLKAMLRKSALRNARNRMQSGRVASKLYGADPFQARQSLLDTERDTSGQTADFLNQADLNQGMGYQSWVRGMLGGERGFEQDEKMTRLRAELEQAMQGGGIGSLLGQLLGIGGGAFLGGAGSALGGRR